MFGGQRGITGRPPAAVRGTTRPDGRQDGPLSVGVFIDLQWRTDAGGHVKCWEHFAAEAASRPDLIDLTLHFLGDEGSTFQLAPNVRYVTHPPLLSTSRFRFLGNLPAHTDLSPLNLKVAPYIKRHQVIHTTGAFFSLSKTARWYARRWSKPLVNSIHTDTPRYTRCFAGDIIRRLTGNGPLGKLLVDRMRLPERTAQHMLRQLDRYLSRCDWVMVSRSEDMERVRVVLTEDRVSVLRRGVDKKTFHPRWRNRQNVKEAYGIPPDRFLILYVGRLDQAKAVMTLARAVRHLMDRGHPVQLMMVGKGAQEGELRALLGPGGTFPGVVPHSVLGWLYASADLFAFPSQTEVCPNVVLEARASGLPVLVSGKGGSAELIRHPERDGFLVKDDDARHWARALEFLIGRRDRLERAGAEARRVIEEDWPTWGDVLEEDLLPVWRALAAEKAAGSRVVR